MASLHKTICHIQSNSSATHKQRSEALKENTAWTLPSCGRNWKLLTNTFWYFSNDLEYIYYDYIILSIHQNVTNKCQFVQHTAKKSEANKKSESLTSLR